MSLSKRKKKIIVNSITASRIVGALILPIMFSFANIPVLIGTLSYLLFTDFIDGKLSRYWNVQTKGGAQLDPLGDKVIAISCILSLMGSYNMLLWPLFLELGITAINTDRMLHEENVNSSLLGKVKTWILSITLILCAINVLNPEFLNLLADSMLGRVLPNISLPDLTITKDMVDTATATTITAQVVTATDYVKKSLKQWDSRSKKIAELKSAKEILTRLFDETKYEEDKDKPLIMIMKK